jgi:serine/threonine-protein kinase
LPGAVHERQVSGDGRTRSPRNLASQRAKLKRALQELQRQSTIQGYRLLADIERERGQHQNYVRILRQLVKLQPGSNTAKANLAVALFQQNKPETAEPILQKISGAAAGDAATMVLLGQTRMRMGQVESALQWFRKALELEADDVETRFNLAIALQLQGNSSEAIEQYDRILATDPQSNEAANNLAWLYATDNNASLRNSEMALRLARDLCERTGYSIPAYMGTLAAALAQAGEFDEAVQLVGSAARIAQGRGENDLAKSLQTRLVHYQQRKPAWQHEEH